ncbi:hypothetical protein BCR44DRAFT_1013459 [Catenaria anguillulae PL171]|uniref:Uncharacterized protein n=1 Tax=Catenaria anguillulae PL171 TaxID=765915 RepID=A0A1Y2I889_9FUNG|nr:hypothetical protein BCR44DRAFT_1013459 [Catenaria anguillulae PL171]
MASPREPKNMRFPACSCGHLSCSLSSSILLPLTSLQCVPLSSFPWLMSASTFHWEEEDASSVTSWSSDHLPSPASATPSSTAITWGHCTVSAGQPTWPPYDGRVQSSQPHLGARHREPAEQRA